MLLELYESQKEFESELVWLYLALLVFLWVAVLSVLAFRLFCTATIQSMDQSAKRLDKPEAPEPPLH